MKLVSFRVRVVGAAAGPTSMQAALETMGEGPRGRAGEDGAVRRVEETGGGCGGLDVPECHDLVRVEIHDPVNDSRRPEPGNDDRRERCHRG